MSSDQDKIQLHLGCGKRFLPGFVHVDMADFEHIDWKSNINDLNMFEDSSADLIYACHVFEYFDRLEAIDVLREWRRVLKPGGTLRLAVPDFLKLKWVYENTGEIEKILGPLFGRWESDDKVIYHKTVYDFKSLSRLLGDMGFGDIRMWDWRKVHPKGYDDHSMAHFPHMDFDKGMLVSLNVEATKNV